MTTYKVGDRVEYHKWSANAWVPAAVQFMCGPYYDVELDNGAVISLVHPDNLRPLAATSTPAGVPGSGWTIRPVASTGTPAYHKGQSVEVLGTGNTWVEAVVHGPGGGQHTLVEFPGLLRGAAISAGIMGNLYSVDPTSIRPSTAFIPGCSYGQHRWEPNGSYDLRCGDCGEESNLPHVSTPAPTVVGCTCGGWTTGSHSSWCDDPTDNTPRKKGLFR